MSMFRTFIALDFPLPLIRRLLETTQALRKRAEQAGLKVAWVPGKNIHLTLKFLGDIHESTAFAVRDRLETLLLNQAGFKLTIRGIGAFPDANKPRVLWAGLDPASTEPLEKLMTHLHYGLEAMGFAPEIPSKTQPFRPHLTLGRVKQGVANIVEDFEYIDFGWCHIGHLSLYKSMLSSTGSMYTALARFPFRAVAESASQSDSHPTPASEILNEEDSPPTELQETEERIQPGQSAEGE